MISLFLLFPIPRIGKSLPRCDLWVKGDAPRLVLPALLLCPSAESSKSCFWSSRHEAVLLNSSGCGHQGITPPHPIGRKTREPGEQDIPKKEKLNKSTKHKLIPRVPTELKFPAMHPSAALTPGAFQAGSIPVGRLGGGCGALPPSPGGCEERSGCAGTGPEREYREYRECRHGKHPGMPARRTPGMPARDLHIPRTANTRSSTAAPASRADLGSL